MRPKFYSVRRVFACLGITRQAYYKRKLIPKLDLSAAHVEEPPRLAKEKRYYRKPDDPIVLEAVQEVLKKRTTYGYRRTTAMLNTTRKLAKKWNEKRIYRVMKKEGLLMPKSGRALRIHTGTGKIETLHSNTRWCSDCFEVRCYNDEKVYVAFILDCKDREVISHIAKKQDITQTDIQNIMLEAVEKRFDSLRAPRQIEFLSDRGAPYRALETQRVATQLNLKSCFTAAYSPASNGMAEALVKTIKRDYVYVNDCESADQVIRNISTWIEDYNENAPHSGLNMVSPRTYIKLVKNL